MKILVAMSGGIDSSVVAHLLKEQGHEVVGVRFNLWVDPLAPALAQVLPSKCCTTQNIARAAAVAKKLGIPLHVLNLEEEFKKEVVDPFLDGHIKGLTTNPCIRCNQTIKFGRLLELAEKLGCEKLATGHYARVAMETTNSPSRREGVRGRGYDTSDITQDNRPPLPSPPPPGEGKNRYLLLEAIDKSKDQSYYLYGLTQEQLSRVLFPLGSMFKEKVYALAEHFEVPFERASYRESQDLCFFPEKNPQAFLKRHLKQLLNPGKIVRRDGTAIGIHQGLPLYTIGQRHGLKIGGLKIPIEVVQKKYSKNQLVVAPKGKESTKKIPLSKLQWVSWKPEAHSPTPFESRNRSLSPKLSGTLTYAGTHGMFTVDSPLPPQAPGQHLVFYRGEEVVGGGIISK